MIADIFVMSLCINAGHRLFAHLEVASKLHDVGNVRGAAFVASYVESEAEIKISEANRLASTSIWRDDRFLGREELRSSREQEIDPACPALRGG